MARWVNPKIVAERAKAAGIEVAELPVFEVYAEPAYDEPTDDPADRALPTLPHPDDFHTSDLDDGPDDLDFGAPFEGAASPADRPAFEPVGISAAGHMARRTFEYDGWLCDCKAAARTGIPPRHFLEYVPHPYVLLWPYRVMIKAGRETKQAKGGDSAVAPSSVTWVECQSWTPTVTLTGWTCACPRRESHRWDGKRASTRHAGRIGCPVYAVVSMVAPEPEVPATECPTWRRTPRIWTRPGRDWRKHGIKPEIAAQPVPTPVTHPAGPVEEPSFLDAADLPKGSQVKSIMLSPGVTSRLKVRGRRTDDGPVVQRYRIAGEVFAAADADLGTPERWIRWVGYWTEGKFDSATVDGLAVTLAELRRFIKGGILPL